MNIWTKFFVVLVTFLSVVLVALVVPFVANTENYKQQRDEALQQKAVAEAAAELKAEELSQLAARQDQQIQEFKQEADKLQTQLNELAEDKRTADAQLQRIEAERDRIEADNRRLIALNEQNSSLVAAFRSELEQRRQDMLSQQTRVIELADRNNELASQRDTLERQFRRLREQLTQLQEENTGLLAMMDRLTPEERSRISGDDEAVSGTQETPVEAGAELRGVVTAVEQISGDTLAMINVGAADGVVPNMKFLVHRGDNFLGTLVITKVDNRESAGRMSLRSGDIRVGDSVLTGGL